MIGERVPKMGDILRALAAQATEDGVELFGPLDLVEQITAVDLLATIDEARKAVRGNVFAQTHIARMLANLVEQKRKGHPVRFEKRAYLILRFYAQGSAIGGVE